MNQALAAVAYQPGGDFTVETITVEAPRRGEVLVRIAGVGLCHTDLVFRDQLAPFALPGVLGHEGSGVIEALGEGVTGLAVGETLDPPQFKQLIRSALALGIDESLKRLASP